MVIWFGFDSNNFHPYLQLKVNVVFLYLLLSCYPFISFCQLPLFMCQLHIHVGCSFFFQCSKEDGLLAKERQWLLTTLLVLIKKDDAIIKHRILTRTTTTRGEPPLKKLQMKFTAFVTEVEKKLQKQWLRENCNSISSFTYYFWDSIVKKQSIYRCKLKGEGAL